MSKEKQIEEMAKAMHDGCSIVKATNQCRGEDCLDCGAVTLYEKGYRKASEVAREIFVEIDNILDYLKIFNSCDDILNAIVYRITKLKKKYTEEGK